MSNYLFVALGKKANRHVFVYHLTNKQKRYVLLTFLLKKIHESKLSSCSWRKTNFSFFYDKTTSIIFKFVYFLGFFFFFCSMINPRISFMPFLFLLSSHRQTTLCSLTWDEQNLWGLWAKCWKLSIWAFSGPQLRLVP